MDMQGGLRIATIRGIPIRIHFSFLLILPLVALGISRAFSVAAGVAEVPPDRMVLHPIVWGVGLAVALFVCVLLHELAHSLYAIHKGGQVEDITLMMLGGVSRLTHPPRTSKDEVVMAFAGPALSILLGLGFGLVFLALGGTDWFSVRFGVFYLATINVFLGLFNLLPAFPMDGGRILRALLVPRLGLIRATAWAARVGKVFAVAFAIWGILSFNLVLVLIAAFVFTGGSSEVHGARLKDALSRMRVRDVMGQMVPLLPRRASVQEAAERMVAERRLSFALVPEADGFRAGTLEEVNRVPLEDRGRVLATEIARPAPLIAPDEEAGQALRLLREARAPMLIVHDAVGPVGVVRGHDLMRALELVRLERPRERWPRAEHPEHA